MTKRGFNLKIIHRHHGTCDGDLMDRLQEVNENVENRIAQLKSFSKKTKEKQKADSHLSEWLEEHGRLNGMQFKLERAIDDSWGSVIASAPSESSEVFEVLDSQRKSSSEIKSLCGLMKNQLDELRQLVAQVKKSAEPATDLPNASASLASAVVADVIMQFRNNHTAHWRELYREEVSLRALVATASKDITSMIRDDALAQADREFSQELLQMLQSEGGEAHALFTLDMLDADVAEVIHSFYERIRLLDEVQAEAAARKEAERIEFCEALSIDPAHPFQGWEASDHDVFSKIYKKAQVTGMKRKLMLDLLCGQLPHKLRDDILLHEEWYRKIKTIQVKYKDGEAVYKTKRQDLMHDARKALAEFLVQKKQEDEQDRLLDEHAARREELHRKLCHLREEKEREMIEQLHDMRAKEADRRAVMEEEDRRRELERANARDLLEVFHRQRQKIVEEERRIQAEKEAATAQALKEEIQKNRGKVEMRGKQIEEKRALRKKKEEDAQREEERRLEVLQRIAQQASYWSAIQDIASRLDHATVSSKAAEYITPEMLSRGHFPLMGFADTTIIKDARFRLVEALRMAGVQHSSAARDAVQHFCPRPHLAIHGIL